MGFSLRFVRKDRKVVVWDNPFESLLPCLRNDTGNGVTDSDNAQFEKSLDPASKICGS